jgi:hypothetical protein
MSSGQLSDGRTVARMFMVKGGAMFCDPDLDFLAEILQVLDRHIASITGEWDTAAECEQFGNFERAEHIMGLGFVACQAYLTATYGFLNVQKSDAFSFGPCHRTGKRIVEIVNQAANYWKHHEEWHLDKKPAQQNRIREVFNLVGVSVDSDYPLSVVLFELVAPDPTAFTPLVAKLANWRDELREARQVYGRKNQAKVSPVCYTIPQIHGQG